MADNEKIALLGFSRLSLFPVTANNSGSYSVGDKFDLPEAQSMTKDIDADSNKIYADDKLYLDLVSWNGINVTITVAEMSLESMDFLGFGIYDENTETLKWFPQGENREFALTFACEMANRKYRMYKMYSFTVKEIKESGTTTKGGNSGINTYQITGTFTARKRDNSPGEIYDGDDLSWLETV